MSQYPFSTRAYGPNAKGSTLTWEDLDNSLLFLSESINELNFTPLSGSNYVFVEANGTPTQNGLALSASYVQAKNSSPSSTNRIAVLAGPGRYTFASNFTLDTQYIDVVSLTGECDVLVTGSGTIIVSANDAYVRGIDVDVKNFTITASLPLLKVKNCKGGDYSFGGNTPPLQGIPVSPGYTIASTFIDCVGGDYSFAGLGSAYGSFTGCVGGNYSFGSQCDGTFTNCTAGDYSFARYYDIEGGKLQNCTAGAYSFASIGNIGGPQTTPILNNCIGGLNSFSQGINSITGTLMGCILTSGSFNTLNVGSGGQLIACANGDGSNVTYP
jgi:hypothetical protein